MGPSANQIAHFIKIALASLGRRYIQQRRHRGFLLLPVSSLFLFYRNVWNNNSNISESSFFPERGHRNFCIDSTTDISRMTDLDTEELLDFSRLLRGPISEDEDVRSL
jgi:hypothetical protein